MVNLVADMMEYHRQQRSFSHPILVHCLGGTGRQVFICLPDPRETSIHLTIIRKVSWIM